MICNRLPPGWKDNLSRFVNWLPVHDRSWSVKNGRSRCSAEWRYQNNTSI